MSDSKKNRYIDVRENKNAYVQRDRKLNSHVVFGVVAFLFVLTYLVFSILSFTFEDKMTYTFAEHGQIVESETFEAIILRDESVYYANEDGPIHYFALEGDKVMKGADICLVDYNRLLSQEDETEQVSVGLTSEETSYLNKQFNNYIEMSRSSGIAYMADGKHIIENTTRELFNARDLSNKNDQLSVLLNQYDSEELPLYKAQKPGLVSFYLDGYESININNVEPSHLNTDSLDGFSYTLDLQKKSGDPLYKVIGNNDWYVYAKVSKQFVDYINEKDEVELSFYKKDLTITGEIREVINDASGYYIKLSFNKYLASFITDRKTEFTIMYKDYVGLKIANSSVITKEFVAVPPEAIEEARGRIGVLVVDETSEAGFAFHPVSFTYNQDELTYIPLDDVIRIDQSIHYKDNDNTYDIALENQPHEVREGVYVINKGYPVFSLIDTMTYNDDYRIIASGTRNGVMIYDRIAADASTVIENTTIK